VFLYQVILVCFILFESSIPCVNLSQFTTALPKHQRKIRDSSKYFKVQYRIDSLPADNIYAAGLMDKTLEPIRETQVITRTMSQEAQNNTPVGAGEENLPRDEAQLLPSPSPSRSIRLRRLEHNMEGPEFNSNEGETAPTHHQ